MADPAVDDRPNIVVILADDLGYGDLSCYNDESRIPTPRVDELAEDGRRFTDAHAPSAVCTPTRYSLLTGRYCWRGELDTGVLFPWDPSLIEPDRLTLPELLGEHGYHSACIGKWHLGWDWPTDDGQPASGDVPLGEIEMDRRLARSDHIDFSGRIPGGPTDRGFDHYFGEGIPNQPPYTWIEDDRVVEEPTAESPPDMFGNPGPMAPGWTLESVMPTITARAVEYVEERGRERAAGGEPFFCYFSLTAPHTPIVPVNRFQGRSNAGQYGDYVCQIDWSVGRILDALERAGVADDTLVIFTSDNGPEHIDGHAAAAYDRAKEYGHYSMDGLRGIKYGSWEGGHRVPFVARWPDAIPAGTATDETICLTDLLRTLASIVGDGLPKDAGEDSYDVSDALRGTVTDGPIREATVHHAVDGHLAIRKGDWVLIDNPTGDVSDDEPAWFREERGYESHDQPGELYDLSTDRIQRTNRYADRPDKVEELRDLLVEYRESGRSVPA